MIIQVFLEPLREYDYDIYPSLGVNNFLHFYVSIHIYFLYFYICFQGWFFFPLRTIP
jgi:hypothetical protein